MPEATPHPPRPALIGTAEAVDILGDVPKATFLRWVSEGVIPVAYRAPHSSFIVFFRDDVIAFARKRADDAATRAAALARRLQSA